MTHIGSFQTVRQTSKEYMSTRTGFKILTSPFLPSKKKMAITRCVPNHYSFLGRIVINLCTCGDRNSYPTRFFSRGKGVLSRNVCFVTVMVVTAHMIDFFFFATNKTFNSETVARMNNARTPSIWKAPVLKNASLTMKGGADWLVCQLQW